jgi:hypothetical protein
MDFFILLEIALAAIALRVAFHFIDKNRIQREVEPPSLSELDCQLRFTLGCFARPAL